MRCDSLQIHRPDRVATDATLTRQHQNMLERLASESASIVELGGCYFLRTAIVCQWNGSGLIEGFEHASAVGSANRVYDQKVVL